MGASIEILTNGTEKRIQNQTQHIYMIMWFLIKATMLYPERRWSSPNKHYWIQWIYKWEKNVSAPVSHQTQIQFQMDGALNAKVLNKENRMASQLK